MNVFISHSADDREIVATLVQLLVKAAKGYDTHTFSYSSAASCDQGIPGGKPWFQWIDEQIDSTSITLVVLTRRSLERPWVLWEFGATYTAARYKALAAAMNRQDNPRAEDSDLPVIPVMIGVEPGALPGPFRPMKAIDGTTGDGVRELIRRVSLAGHTTDPSASERKRINAAIKKYLDDIRAHMIELGEKLEQCAVDEWVRTALTWSDMDHRLLKRALGQLLISPCNIHLSTMVRDLQLLSQQTIQSLDRYLKIRKHSELAIRMSCSDTRALRLAFDNLVTRALADSNFVDTIRAVLGISQFGAYVYAIGKECGNGATRKYLSSCLKEEGLTYPFLIDLIGGDPEQRLKMIEKNIEGAIDCEDSKDRAFGHLLISEWPNIPFAINLEFTEVGEWSASFHWDRRTSANVDPLVYSIRVSGSSEKRDEELNRAFPGSEGSREAFKGLGKDLSSEHQHYMAKSVKGGLLFPIYGEPNITLLILTGLPIDLTASGQKDVESSEHRLHLSPDALFSIRLAGEQLQGLIASNSGAGAFGHENTLS